MPDSVAVDSLVGPLFGSASTASRLELSLIYVWFGICAILLKYAKRDLFVGNLNRKRLRNPS